MPRELARTQLKEKYLTIFHYLAYVIIGNGIIILLPLVFIIPYPAEKIHFWSFILPAAGCIVLGYILMTVTTIEDDVTLNFREGGVLVILTWFTSISIAILPFIFVEDMSFTHAAFEATAGFTTTGLSVVDVEQASKLILFWRSLLQMVGGAGIAIVMISAIIGPQGMGIYVAEGRSDNLIPNIIRSTKLFLRIYFMYLIIGIILYIIAGMNWFDAINHSFSAVSTGGFSTKTDSIGHYNSIPIELVSIILMFLGSINFAAQFLLMRRKWKKFLKIGEVKFKFLILVIGAPLIIYFGAINIYSNLSESIRHGTFVLISAFTTTGFSTTGYSHWHQLSIFVMVLLMIVGGGYGSTSGGIKMFRIHVLLSSVKWQFAKFFLPKNVVKEHHVVRAEGKFYVKDDSIKDIANLVTIYLMAFVLLNLIYLAFGYSIMESLFEAATVLSGVGISIGITSPTAPNFMLWSQVIGMILGRLEFIVVFVGIAKIVKDSKFYYLEND